MALNCCLCLLLYAVLLSITALFTMPIRCCSDHSNIHAAICVFCCSICVLASISMHVGLWHLLNVVVSPDKCYDIVH